MAKYVTPTSDKSKKVSFWLCLCGGFLGLHRYYVLKIGTGMLYTFTFGLFGLGWIKDLVTICFGKFTDNVGLPLRH